MYFVDEVTDESIIDRALLSWVQQRLLTSTNKPRSYRRLNPWIWHGKRNLTRLWSPLFLCFVHCETSKRVCKTKMIQQGERRKKDQRSKLSNLTMTIIYNGARLLSDEGHDWKTMRSGFWESDSFKRTKLNEKRQGKRFLKKEKKRKMMMWTMRKMTRRREQLVWMI
jgi:hypothetical protein